MKRNLIIIAAFVVFIAATMLLGNILIIGEKLGNLHPWAEWTYYAILAGFFLWYFIRPIISIHMASEISRLYIGDDCDINELRKVGKTLVTNMDYIPDKKLREEHRTRLREQMTSCYAEPHNLHELLCEEVNRRIEGDSRMGTLGIDGCIHDWAISSFLVTAISQSKRIDSFSVLVINMRLISDIVATTGFRPTKAQMFIIYCRVLFTSMLSYAVATTLDRINLSGVASAAVEPGEADTDVDIEASDTADMADAAPDGAADITGIDASDMGDIATSSDFGSSTIGRMLGALSAFAIPKVLVTSILDGAANALLTLRVGFITKAYMVQGARAFKGIKGMRSVRRTAVVEAFKSLPKIVRSGSSTLKKRITNKV